LGAAGTVRSSYAVEIKTKFYRRSSGPCGNCEFPRALLANIYVGGRAAGRDGAAPRMRHYVILAAGPASLRCDSGQCSWVARWPMHWASIQGQRVLNPMSEATAFSGPSEPTCMRCGQLPQLVKKILDPRTNRILRMYECECGHRMFDERSRSEADRPPR